MEEKMIKFDKSEMQRFLVSAIGAVAVSATCIGAAIAPAKAADPRAPLSVAEWQTKVESRMARVDEGNLVYQPDRLAVSTVAVNFTADGDYAGMRIAKSSGERLVDVRALRIARTIRYPALPEGFRGTPTQVTMKLYFGPDAEAVVAQEKKKASQTIQLAAL
jgi:TonB family protein